MNTKEDVLLEVKNLKTYFDTDSGTVKAVDDISFSLFKNEILAIVGESGCGKSVTAYSILKLLPEHTKIVSGEINFLNKNNNIIKIHELNNSDKRLKNIRGGEISIIFQDPMTFLNPVYSVGYQILENVLNHVKTTFKKSLEIVYNMYNSVGISNPKKRYNQYPHEFSGGMRQRGMIGMALSGNPSLLIADEPTTALDVTIQAQVLDLIRRLKNQYSMSVILITHDMGVVSEMANNVIVMYMGKIVETAPVKELFDNPKHPYTKKLLESIPLLGKGKNQKLKPIKGSTPDPLNLPKGCSFGPRCDFFNEMCIENPQNIKINGSHYVSCWLYKE